MYSVHSGTIGCIIHVTFCFLLSTSSNETVVYNCYYGVVWVVCVGSVWCVWVALTDCPHLLLDLVGHGLVGVLQLHTQPKVSQLD